MRNLNLIFLSVLFFSVGFVCADLSNPTGTASFSGSTNYQYVNPSLSSVYSSTDINTYWPQLADDIANNRCYGNTDFLVMIPPSGCTPSVVRSDLLAEQNVPVFCQLESAKVNPLIKVSSIKSISFRGKYPTEIAGVSYYPARAALNSYNTLLGSPVVNNIGYVVIILKKQSNETASPKNVSGNLTATLYYDAEKAFGVGSSEFYLRTMSDDEWESSKYLQGFWQGRGVLRLVDVQNDQATIEVLTPDGAKIRTETLTRGQTGGLFYFPGFYCRAGLQLKLNDIDSPEDSVILSVDGVQMEARKTTKLGNTGCRVTNLNVLAGDTGTVKVSCGGKTLDLSLLSLYKANVTNSQNIMSTYEMASRVPSDEGNYYFAYAGVTKKPIESISADTEFVVMVKSESALENKVYSEISANVYNTFNSKRDVAMTLTEFKNSIDTTKAPASNIKILFSGDRPGDSVKGISFKGLVTTEGEDVQTTTTQSDKELASTYFKEGENVLSELLNDYSYLSNSTGTNYGESALIEEIELAKRLQQKGLDYNIKKVELMNKFLELYPSSALAESIRSQLTIAQRTDSTNAYKSVFANNEYHTIGIVQFKPAPSSSKTFELVMNNKNVPDETGSILWHEGDQINLSLNSGTKNTNDYLIVKTITSKEVVFEYYSTKLQDGKQVSYLSDGAFRLSYSTDSNTVIEPKKLSSGATKNEAYSLYLSDVQVEKNAYVSIVSELKTTSEANFTFNIGIEQRVIKLSPEQAQDQADELNKTIAKWEEKNAQLGKLVEGWKAVCLATGLALNVKNLITGFTGQSTARQEVMQVYKVKCKQEVAAGNYPTVDVCYNHYSDDISKDVDSYTGAIEGINDEIKNQYHGNISEFQSGSTCSYKASNGQIVSAKQINSWSEARQCLLYNRLSGSTTITEGLRSEINADTSAQLDDIARNAEANKGYETSLSELPESIRGTYFKPIIDNNKVKVVSSVAIDKATLKNVFGSAVKEFEGEGSRSVATTNSGGVWYLLILGSGSSVASTYTFDLSNKQVSNVLLKTDLTGLPNNRDTARWDVDMTSNIKCVNNYTNPTVRFYESANDKGMPAYVPVDLKEGWYVYIPSTQGNTVTTAASNVVSTITTGKAISGYTDAGEVTFMYLCNVGPNGREDQRMNDDICQSFNTNNNNFEGFSGCSIQASEIRNLISRAKTAIRYVASNYKSGVRKFSIPNVGDNVEVEPGMMGASSNNFVCQDFFSPEECKFMYNVCDPVICPTSRCNFGGKIAVPNVIQSGILGSAVLCLKNFVGFGGDVYMPVCLTGIHAGIEGYISILKAQQKCLSEYSKSGKHVGICDEITAVYKCEFFWRQVSPLMKNIIPSLAELAYTAKWGGQANGGEYATFQQSWDNMQSSIDYFKNNYASTSFTAYKFGNVEEIGSTYCRNFLGTSIPTSAEAIESMLKPESPAQFYGTFSSIPYTTATVPATSQYKVFYHIYAGTDIGASYTVYLKDPPSLSYYSMPAQVHIISGYLTKGEQASETKDFTAPSGYKQMCLVVNDQEECGFNSVSTDFAVDVINDLYVQEQGNARGITTEDECISGTSSIYSLLNPNVQEGVDNAINPDVSLLGITRICATQNPGVGKDSKNWQSVGYCGSKNLTCWLDNKSVQNAQKVLQKVGSISEAIEYLAANSSERVVSDDMKKTSEKLSDLKKSIAKLTLSPAIVKGGVSSIDNALSPVLGMATDAYTNAKLDANKAEALYLRVQLYIKVVKTILNIKDSEGEKSASSQRSSAPSLDSSVLDDSSSSGDITLKDIGSYYRIMNKGSSTAYRIFKNSYDLYKDDTRIGKVILGSPFYNIAGYRCTFDGKDISCSSNSGATADASTASNSGTSGTGASTASTFSSTSGDFSVLNDGSNYNILRGSDNTGYSIRMEGSNYWLYKDGAKTSIGVTEGQAFELGDEGYSCTFEGGGISCVEHG